MSIRLRWLMIAAVCLAVLAGCSQLDRAAQPEPVPPAASPEGLQATSSDIELGSPREQCQDDATFLQDLTVPDGTAVEPGASVDKRWSVRNSGSCDWGPGYRLIPDDPNPLVGNRETALYPAEAGTSASWRVVFEAPDEPGEYAAAWRAYNPEGDPFGDPVFVLIVVADEDSEARQATDSLEQ